MKNKLWKMVPHIVYIPLCLVFIIPFIAIISVSVSNDVEIVRDGFRLIPSNLDFTAYEYIFKNPRTILTSYKVTAIMTFVSLIIYLVMASMMAYALSSEEFKGKKGVTLFLLFTMLFNGGMVPNYLLMTQGLHLKDTYSALIIPLLGNVWYVFIMRTFMGQIPKSLKEAALLDGASELRIFFNIILPLSKPVLATVGVITMIANWNSWNQALLYIDDPDLYPLQYMLEIMLRNIQELTKNMKDMPAGIISYENVPTESTRMAMAVVATGPMLFVFPFFQKYFVSGLTVGAVKG